MTRSSPTDDTSILSSQENSRFLCRREQVLIAARSKAWVCGRSFAEIVGSNPTGATDVCLLCECWVFSGIGLCDELITRPEKSYRLWCVRARSRHLKMRMTWLTLGLSAIGKKKWRREVHWRVHKSSPLDHIQNQMSKPSLWHPLSLMFILILSPHVSLGVSFPTARLCYTLSHVGYVCRLYTI